MTAESAFVFALAFVVLALVVALHPAGAADTAGHVGAAVAHLDATVAPQARP